MIRQASVKQVREQQISRENTHIVICMCFYPRGIKKEWRDHYTKELAPDRELFAEWKAAAKTAGHEKAFAITNYESRFKISPLGLSYVKMYSRESREKDIYFVCQCEVGQKCHREMLMLLARERFGASVDKIFNEYPVFKDRLPLESVSEVFPE